MLTMTISARPGWHHPAAALLNRLIRACHDGAGARTAAALVVNGSRQRAQLEDDAGRRLAFAHELAELVRSFGGTPADRGSVVEGIRAAAHRVDALLVGEHGGDAYGICARIEASTERLYEAALEAELPGPARSVVIRHHDEIVKGRAELRRFSMGG